MMAGGGEDLSIKVGVLGADPAAAEFEKLKKASAAAKDELARLKKVSDEVGPAFAKLSNHLQQSAAFVQQQAQKTQAAAAQHAQTIQGTQTSIVQFGSTLANLRTAFQQGGAQAGGLGGALNLMKGILTPTGLAVTGVAAALGAMVVALTRSADAALQTFERIKELQAVSGLSADAADDMADAFDLAGANTGALSNVLFRLGNEIETGGASLARLGINIRKSSGEMKAEGEILLEVRDKISELGTAGERSAALMDLFGRSARALIPAFSKTREEFAALLEETRKYGAVNSEFMAQAADLQKAMKLHQQRLENTNVEIAKMIGFPFAQTMTDWKSSLMGWPANIFIGLSAGASELISSVEGVMAGKFMSKPRNAIAEAAEAQAQAAALANVADAIKKGKDAREAAEGKKQRETESEVRRNQTTAQAEIEAQRRTLTAASAFYTEKSRLESDSAQAGIEERIRVNERMIELANELYERMMAEERKLLKNKEGFVLKETEEKLARERNAKTEEANNANAKLRLDAREALVQETKRDLKEDEAFLSEKLQYETNSAQASIALKIETNKKIQALAQEQYGGADNKVSKEAALEARKLDLDLSKAKAADSKRDMEDQGRDAKVTSDLVIRALEDTKNRELTINDMRRDSTTAQVLQRRAIEERAAAETQARRLADIAGEEARMRALAALYPQDAALQREVNQKLADLGRDRVLAESDADNKILAARKAMVDGLQAEADKEAGIGESVTSKALANLKKRGKTRASESDVLHEVDRMRTAGAEATSGFRGGGRVKIEALEEAMGNKGMFRDMAKSGMTAGGGTMQMLQQMMQAFQGRNPNNVPTSMQGQKSATMLGEDPGASDRWAKQRTEDFKKTAEGAVGKLDFAQVFDAFGDALVRKLEFEAQRG